MPDDLSNEKPIPPKAAIDGAIATLREAFFNVGAEGESVHLVCDEVERQREYLRRFYVAWGPHLPESWREHFEEILRERPFFGLVDLDRDTRKPR
jgi:hypothetical protein